MRASVAALGLLTVASLACEAPPPPIEGLVRVPGIAPLVEARGRFACRETGCSLDSEAPSHRRLRATLARNYADGLRVAAPFNPACAGRIVPLDVGASTAIDVRREQAVFAEVRPGQTSMWIPRETEVEELLWLERPARSVRYRIDLEGDARAIVRVGHGGLEIRDGEGHACVRAPKPFLIDSDGKRHEAEYAVRGHELTISWEASGIRWPAALDPVWASPVGSLSIARSDPAVAVLPNGKILVAGGNNAGNDSLNTWELFDSATGSWTTGSGTMTAARSAYSLTVLPDGTVLAIGGLNQVGSTTTTFGTAEVYDPSKDSANGCTSGCTPWTATSNSLATARYGHQAHLLTTGPNAGKVLVVGAATATAVVELYDPATRTFSSTASRNLNKARNNCVSVRLPDGRVLATVGNGASLSAESSAELYDPSTDRWTLVASSPTARNFAGATLLATGQVLVYGGTGGFSELASADLFDPAGAGSWAAAGSMAAGRFDAGAALLPSGKLLVAGGMSGAFTATALGTTELYTPGTGWNAAAANPPMVTGHGAAAVTMLPGGRVLVAGGQSGNNTTYTASTELYDPAAPVWVPSAGLLSAKRQYPSVALLPSGKVLVAGGFNDAGAGAYLSSADVYDPATDGFAPTANAMSTAREFATATVLGNGKVLIVGGEGSNGAPLATSELYDPATNTFGSVASLAAGRRRHTATLLGDGQVLVVGGCDTSAVCPANAELYDPASNRWSTIANPVVQPRYVHMATLLRSGQVLIFGGSQPGSGALWYRTSELYDPVAKTFTRTGDMNTGRELSTAVLMPDGRVLAAGGLTGTSAMATAEAYSPASGLWTAAGVLANARTGASATLLEDGRVLVAGGTSGGPVGPAELYDPARGVFTSAGTVGTAPFRTGIALLPSGQVLLVGGASGTTNGSALNTAERFDLGFGIQAGMRPAPTFAASYAPGASYSVTGARLRGVSEGSSGNFQANASSDHPLLQLTRVDNGDQRFVPTYAVSPTSLRFDLPSGWPLGLARAQVISNGSPSLQTLVRIGAQTSAVPTALAFTNVPYAISAGGCAGPYTVQSEDGSGSALAPTTPLAVTLLPGSGAGQFWSSATCTGTAITSTAIASGTSTAPGFYYSDTTVGTATLTARTSGLTDATQSITITSVSPPTGAPAISQDANPNAMVGTAYRYNAQGRVLAAGALPMSFDRCAGPAELLIDPVSGEVRWTPSVPGPVSICLRAVNALGEDRYTFTVDVVARTPTPVTAAFTATPASGPAPLGVAFDASASTADPGALPLLFSWDPGDGSPLLSGSAPRFTYARPGGYRVTLWAFDAFGTRATATGEVLVADALGNVPPSAKIVASATSATGSLTVHLSCDCTPGSAPIAGHRWELGGAEVSSLPELDHTFGPGRHHVALTVVDAAGLPATDRIELVVADPSGRAPPECRAELSPSSAVVPFTATYRAVVASPTGAPLTVRWEFDGPADAVDGALVQRDYSAPARVQARLIVSDDLGLGCEDERELTAMPAPAVVPLRIVSVPGSTGLCGAPYVYGATGAAVAEGTSPVTWSLAAAPAGATLDAQSGALTWTPRSDQQGPQAFTLVAANEAGATQQGFSVDVVCGAPAVLQVGCGCQASEGASFAAAGLALLVLARRRRPRTEG